MHLNKKSYKFYVVADNAIESGHNKREDALDRSIEASSEGFASVKITTNPDEFFGLDPDKDESWIEYWLKEEEDDLLLTDEEDDYDDDLHENGGMS